jgi:hypothetical protein
LIQDRRQRRNLDSKIYLPGFHRFKFQFHSFFAENFSTVSVSRVGLMRRRRSRHVRFASTARWHCVRYVMAITKKPRRKAAPKRGAGTERVSQAFPVRRNTRGGRVFIVNLTSQSAAVTADTMRSNSMFASASLTPPLPTHSAIALVMNA